jgi:hypothetical protein
VKCDRYTTDSPLIGQQRVHNRLQTTFGSGGSASSVCVSQSRSFVVRHIWRLSDSTRIMITSVPQKGCVCNPAAPREMKHACRHGATLGNPCAERGARLGSSRSSRDFLKSITNGTLSFFITLSWFKHLKT